MEVSRCIKATVTLTLGKTLLYPLKWKLCGPHNLLVALGKS